MYFKIAVGNVHKSIRDYGIYFITLVFGVCVFYAFNSITVQDAVLDFSTSQRQMIQLLSMLINGVSVFIAVVLGFLIVYASRYLIRRRKKEFGTYLLLGMPTGKVSRIIVYETLLVGLFSLAVGLIVGIGLSQLLLYVTAALFTITFDTFNFVLSTEALLMTVAYFAIIFLVALVFNTITVSRYKLIDLINAHKKNEGVKLRNIPLAVVLFLISVAMIGVAYYLLIDNGMAQFDEQFAASTALVCVGTFLLFYSLAGFLLRAVQANKKLYLRGLNMFTMRQLSSKINTTFFLISLVCITLFLAIMATCGGFGMVTSFNNSMASSTKYDASFVSYYGGYSADDAAFETWIEEATADEMNIERALERDVDGWDDLVADAAEYKLYDSDVNLEYVVDNTDYNLSSSLYSSDFGESYLAMVPISEFNELLRLNGLDSIELGSDQYLLWCDFEEVKGLYQAFLDQHDSLSVLGHDLKTADQPLQTVLSRTAMQGMMAGGVIVPDEIIPEDMPYLYGCLNVMYDGERTEVEPLFTEAVDNAFPEGLLGWPVNSISTAEFMYEQSAGLTAIITYLAIYVGFVLLIACAAMLALQQLSEAADNVSRYGLLEKIGVEHAMMNKALFMQVGVYFIFPLVVALCHSGVALSVLNNVLALLGISNLTGPLLITLGLLVVVYGGYFLVTYFGSRSIIHQKISA